MPQPDPTTNELRPAELGRMREMLQQTWDGIREWLAAHPNRSDRQNAAMHQGQFLTTTLHMVCKLSDPPVDVVQSLIECSEETVTWPDSNGWLPLHHACANGASGKVLAVLVEAYPEGKIKQDKRYRTPLHFAFFRKDAQEDKMNLKMDARKSMMNPLNDDEDDVGNSMPEIVALLADSGAAELQDEGGMLPMHYASAYGTTREVLEVLLEAYPESITKRENKGRTPLHLAMVNAHRKSSPKVVGFLLEVNAAEIINVYDDDSHLPIHLLSMASKFPEEKIMERKNASDCLKLYLNARPKATADFLTAIQTLPEWLRDIAVISDHIQNILNHKIVQRFPTMILILDFSFLIMVIVVFEITTSQTIDYLFGGTATPTSPGLVFLTFVAGAYFLLREMVQIVSLMALGNAGSWMGDMGNWLDVALIFLIFYFGGVMFTNSPMSNDAFRSGTAITKGIMWMSMFYIIYAQTEECACTSDFPEANPFPHCDFKWSNEMRYSTLPIAQFLYIAFAFLVVILLSNVLIAIVTDSYGVIKNERSAMVFWANRLDFVAEMDAIKNVGKRIKACCGKGDGAPGAPTNVQETPNGEPIPLEGLEEKASGKFRTAWQSLMNLFDRNLYETYDVQPSSPEFWCYVLVRFGAFFFAIPLWLLIGLCTAGWLWPPQVREWLFQQKKAAISRADMAQEVTNQINQLKAEIMKLRIEMKGEMKSDRKEFAGLKTEVEAIQAEVMADLLQVKEIMVTLLDMSRDNLGTR
eukprot:scaffold33080_cov148-Skeletonema_menzelii.AAC.1